MESLVFFFGFTPPLSLNSEIRGCAQLLGEPLGLQGREVVFFEMSGVSVAGKFKLICKYLLCFGFALSNQISDICKINLFRNGLILFISIQSFGH